MRSSSSGNARWSSLTSPHTPGAISRGSCLAVGSALPVTADVTRDGHAPVQPFENFVQHADMAFDRVAAVQDAAVARGDGLDVAAVEHVGDAAPDGIGRRP